MPAEEKNLLFTMFRELQNKYVYFLIATAVVAVAMLHSAALDQD